VGKQVLAYNPKTGKMEDEPILHVWINHDHDLVDLTMTTTIKGQHDKPATRTSEVIHTNQKHPFLTMERGFLPVGQITLGMHILRADGRVGVVTGWKMVPGASVMYNLEVAQDHTYTVGDGQWVVHNCASGPTISQNAANHIFRNAPGHMSDDTPQNRQFLIDTVLDSQNYVGTDQWGNQWYTQTLSNGKQVWVEVRNGKIINGGINDIRWAWNPNTQRLSP
jgi:hypothetical protein